MKNTLTTLAILALAVWFTGCKKENEKNAAENRRPAASVDKAPSAADKKGEKNAEGEEHTHDEVPLGTVAIGELEVELAQGHGRIEAGKESHLVVKLPYDDKGATIVRAWLGTEDRTQSLVGKGEYAASHGDYDIHAVAPDPLSDNIMWWIEIQKPDGSKLLGSAKPRL
jgi:hypothetical protein